MGLLAFPANRRKPVVASIILVLAVGFLRVGLSLAGLSDSVVTFLSITAVLTVGLFYFGLTASNWKEMLVAAYGMILGYTLVSAVALGYTFVTGQHTIFARGEHNMVGQTVGWHLTSMVIGGLSWEPLWVFGGMALVGWVAGKVRRRRASIG